MLPPYLKKSRWPALAKPREERSFGLSYQEKMHDQVSGELMDAAEHKDAKRFRSALEALILNLFEDCEDEPARDA